MMERKKIPKSPELKDLRKDWTECQEDQARHNAWQDKTTDAGVHKAKFFKDDFPIVDANSSKPNPIIQPKDRMYTADIGASWISAGNEHHTRRPKTTWSPTPRMASSVPQRDDGLHPGARHSP